MNKQDFIFKTKIHVYRMVSDFFKETEEIGQIEVMVIGELYKILLSKRHTFDHNTQEKFDLFFSKNDEDKSPVKKKKKSGESPKKKMTKKESPLKLKNPEKKKKESPVYNCREKLDRLKEKETNAFDYQDDDDSFENDNDSYSSFDPYASD
jgi:hypothetical protein